MHLRMLAGERSADVDVYRPSPFDLSVQPLRPGLAHEALPLALDPQLAGAVEQAAARDGVPTSLWAAIVVESERMLHSFASATTADPAALASLLDDAARQRHEGLANQRARRLVRYALALRDTAPRKPTREQSPLDVTVPHHTLIAWELAAAEKGQPVERWAIGLLGRLPRSRPSWESAAALRGQTLSDWIAGLAVQAARRSSD